MSPFVPPYPLINPKLDLGVSVSALALDILSERILPCRENMFYVPSHPHEYVAWGFLDQSLRLYSDRKVSAFPAALTSY